MGDPEQLLDPAHQPRRRRLGLGPARAPLPVAVAAAVVGDLLVPLLGHPHVRVDPGLGSSISRSEWWWTTWRSAVTTFLPAVARLHADVEVIAVDLAQRLVEAQVRASPTARAPSRSRRSSRPRRAVAYGGSDSVIHEKAGISPPPSSS